MALPTIYTLFRSLIGDTVSDYVVADLMVLIYLDQAIDALSLTVKNTYRETYTLTQTDINNSYFDLQREVVDMLSQDIGTQDLNWQLAGGKRIRFIDTSGYSAGRKFTVFFKAKYNKFYGVLKDQSEMDIPSEANFAVALYAVALYIQANAVPQADGSMKYVTEKSEENMKVSYNGSMLDLSKPESILKMALSMMRSLPNAESAYFSVKI